MLQITPETLAYLKNFRFEQEEKQHRKAAQKAAERRRQLSKGKFEALVEVVVPILQGGEPTKFRFEGTCRYAIRVRLIERGFTWKDADANAVAVVSEGLKRIGAKRPSWLQGQPEWRDRDRSLWQCRYCPTCGGVLDDDHAGIHCSVECATVTRKRLWQRENRETMYALQRAWAKANPEKVKEKTARHIERLDPRPCLHCGTEYKAKASVRFCSPQCGYDHRKAEASKRNERQCASCLTIFVSRKRPGRLTFDDHLRAWGDLVDLLVLEAENGPSMIMFSPLDRHHWAVEAIGTVIDRARLFLLGPPGRQHLEAPLHDHIGAIRLFLMSREYREANSFDALMAAPTPSSH